HRRRAVREFQRQRRGDRQRPQPIESFGYDFWPLHAGGTGFRERGKAGVSPSEQQTKEGWGHGKEDSDDDQVATASGESYARAAGIAKGSAEPNRNKVGKVTRKQVEEIAKIKLVDLNTTNLESAMRTVMGTARNMGLEVVEA